MRVFTLALVAILMMRPLGLAQSTTVECKARLIGKPLYLLGLWRENNMTFSGLRPAQAQSADTRLVRIAELQIDPTQLAPYKAALKEEIEASIRLEPGVLTLYAVSVKGHPDQIRLFETYASPAAYQSHLQTPHFKKYKSATAGMVQSLTLLETDPILLGAKPR